MGKKNNHFLCDEDCNNCETIRNPQLSLLLNVLKNVFGNDVIGVTNAVCPNMTCCANCHIDDMCHLEDDDGKKICDIEKKARKISDWYVRTNMKSPNNDKDSEIKRLKELVSIEKRSCDETTEVLSYMLDKLVSMRNVVDTASIVKARELVMRNERSAPIERLIG